MLLSIQLLERLKVLNKIWGERNRGNSNPTKRILFKLFLVSKCYWQISHQSLSCRLFYTNFKSFANFLIQVFVISDNSLCFFSHNIYSPQTFIFIEIYWNLFVIRNHTASSKKISQISGVKQKNVFHHVYLFYSIQTIPGTDVSLWAGRS
jgi:hypothetical protein